MSDWHVRRAVREDEACIVKMWMHQLLRHSFPGPKAGAPNPPPRPKPGSGEHIAFWRSAQPVIEGLLRSASVTALVACDPERATHAPGAPAVVCGWSISDAKRVYGVGLKRDYLPSPERGVSENETLREIGTDLARATLGAALEQPLRTVMPLFDLHRLGLPTPLWTRDDAWLDLMADISRSVEDGATADVGRHIYDLSRVPWVPNEQRAA